MENNQIIKFIEAYAKRNEDDIKEFIFNVSFHEKYKPNCIKAFWVQHNIWSNNDTRTITLDEDDLKYLYDKYSPFYKDAVIERDEKIKVIKQKEIDDLETKLNKLKNGI